MVIFPLHKKCDPTDLATYRGLFYINCLAKTFACMLANRLLFFVEGHDLLFEFQFGLRKIFSRVNRGFIFCKLPSLGISLKFVAFLRDFYPVSALVWTEDVRTATFSVNSDVLFAVFVNTAHVRIDW